MQDDPAHPEPRRPSTAASSGPVPMSVDSLRRSSPAHRVTPTRTLRLSEAEHLRQHRNSSSREGTPLRLLVAAAESRSLSNPRKHRNGSSSRRRYESPLDPDEFRLKLRLDHNLEAEASSSQRRRVEEADAQRRLRAGAAGAGSGPGRVTIRSLAGTAVGTTASSRTRVTIPEERTSSNKSNQSCRSRKQGPSHRKVRRWNNDRFRGVAAEIAAASSSSSRGPAAAEAFLKGQAERHLYRDVYDPAESSCDSLTRFFTDDELREVRERYRKGELPLLVEPSRQHAVSNRRGAAGLTLEERMNLIDSRLRRVVVRAVQNSYPAGRALERFESFLVRVFTATFVPGSNGPSLERSDSDASWDGLLIKAPTVEAEENRDGSPVAVVHFYFDPESSTGGFHRLLLRACAQFHGLEASSGTARVPIQGKPEAKALTAKGIIDSFDLHRLLTACEEMSAPH